MTRSLVMARFLRQLLLSYVVVFLRDKPWLIIFVFNNAQLAYIMLLASTNFFRDRKTHVKFVIMEVCVLVAIYIFIGLSDIV